MRRLSSVLAGMLMCAGGALAASGQPPASGEPAASVFATPREEPAVVALITEHASLRPGGSTRVGVAFDLAEGWHIYFSDPGDAGLPTEIAWSGPPGVQFSPLVWPEPEQFDEPGGITTNGYSGHLVLSSTLSYPATRDGEPLASIPLTAAITWLACRDICIPGSATRALTLPVSSREPALTTHAWLFDQVP